MDFIPDVIASLHVLLFTVPLLSLFCCSSVFLQSRRCCIMITSIHWGAALRNSSSLRNSACEKWRKQSKDTREGLWESVGKGACGSKDVGRRDKHDGKTDAERWRTRKGCQGRAREIAQWICGGQPRRSHWCTLMSHHYMLPCNLWLSVLTSKYPKPDFTDRDMDDETQSNTCRDGSSWSGRGEICTPPSFENPHFCFELLIKHQLCLSTAITGHIVTAFHLKLVTVAILISTLFIWHQFTRHVVSWHLK